MGIAGSMASYDFIDATNRGYGFVWKNRMLILKLAAFPFVVKFVCLLAISAFGLDNNFLRAGLLQLPAMFIEGWLIANILRLAFFNDIGANLTGDPERDQKALYNKTRDLMAGTIVYVLLQLTGFAMIGAIGVDPEMMAQQQQSAPEREPSMQMFIVAMLVLTALLWMLRVYFLYIPVMLGYSMKEYFRKMAGLGSSFYLLAGWLMCYLPLILLATLGFDILKALAGLGPEQSVEDISGFFWVIGLAWRVVIELLAVILAAMVLGYGIVMVMTGQNIRKDKNKT